MSKLSTHVPFTFLAELFSLCVISLFCACVFLLKERNLRMKLANSEKKNCFKRQKTYSYL